MRQQGPFRHSVQQLRRHRAALTVVIPLAAALAMAGCGSSSKSKTASAPATTATTSTSASAATGSVKTGSTSLGTVLVSSSGLTLYHLTGEGNGKFLCTSACVKIWHPVVAQGGQAPTGVSSLTVVKRPDGTQQVAYKGEPLYTFVQDTSAGSTKGQGVKDVGIWKVIALKAAAATPAPAPAKPPASTSTSGGSSGGYGY